jgi:hypothetical protein
MARCAENLRVLVVETFPTRRDKKGKGKEKEKKQVVLLWNGVKSRKNTKQQEFGRRREGMGLKYLGCIPSMKTFHSRYAVVFTTA